MREANQKQLIGLYCSFLFCCCCCCSQCLFCLLFLNSLSLRSITPRRRRLQIHHLQCAACSLSILQSNEQRLKEQHGWEIMSLFLYLKQTNFSFQLFIVWFGWTWHLHELFSCLLMGFYTSIAHVIREHHLKWRNMKNDITDNDKPFRCRWSDRPQQWPRQKKENHINEKSHNINNGEEAKNILHHSVIIYLLQKKNMNRKNSMWFGQNLSQVPSSSC